MNTLDTTLTIPPLSAHFTQGKVEYTQLQRAGDVALYKRRFVGNKYDDRPQGDQCFEVIVIKRHNGYHLGDQFIEPAETYPCSSLWGTLGWTYQVPEKEKAEQKFKQLVQSGKYA